MITNITDQLKRDEGLRLTPYADTRGFETVGYGHRVYGSATTIDVATAEALLASDITIAEHELQEHLPWTLALPAVYQGVVINLTYNMGINTLLEFKTTLALLHTGRYSDAADELLRSAWAMEVGTRAHRLYSQLKTGTWQ
jgi:lysozyme